MEWLGGVVRRADFHMPETANHPVLAIHPVLEGIALNPQAGGKDLAASECTDVLLEMNCRVSVWPLVWGEIAATEKILSRHHEILWSKHGRIKLVPTFAFNGSLRGPLELVDDVLNEYRPRLVHVHQTQNPFVQQVKRKSSGAFTLLSNHSGVVSSYIDEYDQIVVPSRWMRKKILASRPELASRVQTIPYFLQAPYLRDEPEVERSGIVFIGLLNDNRKGLDTLLEALAVLKDRHEIYPLTVVGEGRRLSQCRELANRLNLDVTFLTRLSCGENRNLLRRSSLFCMPSREENFPFVFIESLACGAPIVGFAPAVTELSQILECEIGSPFNGENGNPEELADSVSLWMRDKCGPFAERRELLRRRVRDAFSIDAYRAAYRKLYERLLAA